MNYNAVLDLSHYTALGNGTALRNRKQWETEMAMVDELQTTVSDATLATRWHMHDPQPPDVEAVVAYGDYTFTSVHLALVKPHRPNIRYTGGWTA